MKILLVHNFYRSSAPSGENTVYLAEQSLLQNAGHRVIEFTRTSDELTEMGGIGTVNGALSTPWNPFSMQKIRRILRNEKPDILHAHNTFPLFSPAIFHAARNSGTATVLTLHNYRIFCTAGIPMRNGVPCTECIDKRSVAPSLKYSCYRQSRLATLPMAAMISLHRNIGTWHKDVDAFIALTEFQKNKMIDGGLPAERMHVKPHFYPNPPKPLIWHKREPKVVFVGRLGIEKGVHVLIDAWKKWGDSAPFLDLIGDGPERYSLEKAVRQTAVANKIHFWGQLSFSQAQEKLSRAKLLVLPSLWFEGFPMVIREAFALGVPVAASRLGSMPYIITDHENGILFSPGNSEELYRRLKALWDTPELSVMANNARQEFERKYTSEKNHQYLMEIYQAAIAVRRGRKQRNRAI